LRSASDVLEQAISTVEKSEGLKQEEKKEQTEQAKKDASRDIKKPSRFESPSKYT